VHMIAKELHTETAAQCSEQQVSVATAQLSLSVAWQVTATEDCCDIQSEAARPSLPASEDDWEEMSGLLSFDGEEHKHLARWPHYLVGWECRHIITPSAEADRRGSCLAER